MYRHILSFNLFLIFLSFSTANNKFRSDYVYNNDAAGWLKVHKIPTNFRDAFLRCNFEGAVLASPTSEKLKNTILTAAQRVDVDAVYTGIHSTESNGDFSTVDGIPLEQIEVKWAENQPDNFENQENCLVMLESGALNDVACNETYSYVCYKKKTNDLDINECGTIDSEYNLDNSTGSCYKFHTRETTWRRGHMICSAEGGHLAVINSQQEADVLKELFVQNAPDSEEVVGIGFRNWGNGLWFTVHGVELEKSGYSNWSKDEPNTPIDEDCNSCGAMYKTGLLDDVDCNSYKLPFICEKSPKF